MVCLKYLETYFDDNETLQIYDNKKVLHWCKHVKPVHLPWQVFQKNVKIGTAKDDEYSPYPMKGMDTSHNAVIRSDEGIKRCCG